MRASRFATNVVDDDEDIDMSPQIPNAVKLPEAVLAEPAELVAPNFSSESLSMLRVMAHRKDEVGVRDHLKQLGVIDQARQSEVIRSLGVRIGIVCMTKCPVNFETWLTYHAEMIGVERFYLRIEDTPDLADLLSRPPWDSLVYAKFAMNTSTDWCNVALRAQTFAEDIIERATNAGCTHLLHLDDDELLFCPSGRLALDSALSGMAPTECEAHALTIEALAPSTNCVNPYTEATTFRHNRHDFTSYGSHCGAAGKSFGRLSCSDLQVIGPHHFKRKRYGRCFEVDKGDFAHTKLLPPPVAIILHYESACLEHWRRKYIGYARTVHAGRKQRFSFPFYLESLEACLRYVRAEDAGDARALAEAEAAMVETWSRWKLQPEDLPARSQRPPVQLLSERGLTILCTGAAAAVMLRSMEHPHRYGCIARQLAVTARARATTSWRPRTKT